MTKQQRIEEHRILEKPYYQATGNEIALATAAGENGIPLLLKGPTGCGKTRLMHYLAWKLQRPLITVSCHDDLSTSDLVGRYLIRAGEAVWQDGPLTLAVRHGAICYLDEIVEARKDTTVVIHPLADDRRELPVEKKGELLTAADGFMLAVSYNPGYQSVLKDLKPSTRQRFAALALDYPDSETETEIVRHESDITPDLAASLVKLAHMTRSLRDSGLPEGASTRLLIQAGKLIVSGVDIPAACRAAITEPLTDDPELSAALNEMVASLF